MKIVFLSFLYVFGLVISANHAIGQADLANAAEKPVKIAIIGYEGELAKELDLLTVEFSKDRDYKVLSRSDWTKLIREYEILKKDTASAYSKFGNISGADALIILDKQSFKKQDYLICKLVSTKNGLILDALALTYPVVSKEKDWIGGVKKHFGKKIAKLANADNGFQTVSLLNLRAETSSPELLELEKHLNAVFAYRLKSNENILVTERENMPEVLFEKYLNKGDESEFRTGAAVVDGSFNLKGETIAIKLRVKNPDGKLKTFEISGKKEEIAKIAANLEEKVLISIGEQKTEDVSWDMKKEAQEYLEEAVWAYHSGMYEIAARASESAWALECRNKKIFALRVLSYANIASPIKESFIYNYDSKLVDVTKTDSHLNAAIIAMELLKRHFINPLTNRKKIPPTDFIRTYFSWRDLADVTIHSSSKVLRSYYEQTDCQKDQLKLAYLRKLICEVYPLIVQNGPGNDIWDVAMKYIPYWYENFGESKKEYIKVLLDSRRGAGKGYCSGLRRGLSHRPTSFFIDWNKRMTPKELDSIAGEFADELCKSDIHQLKADGLWMKYWNNELCPGEPRTKIKSQFCELAVDNKELIYQGKLWFSQLVFRMFFTPEITREIIMGYPLYLINNPKGKQGPNIHSIIKNDIMEKSFSDEDLKKLHSLLIQWEEKENKTQILKKSQFRFQKMNNFSKLKEIIYERLPELKKGPSDSVVISKYWTVNRRKWTNNKKMTYTLGETCIFKDKIFCLGQGHGKKVVYKDSYFIYVLDEHFNVEKEIRVDLDLDSWFGSLCVNDEYIAITSSMPKIVLYNRKKQTFKTINFDTRKISQVCLLNDSIYACYSVSNEKKRTESGIIKMDMDGKNVRLLASTRRNPPETPLDNVKPYLFTSFETISRDSIILSTNFEGTYVIKNDRIYKFGSMDADFYNKHIDKIYKKRGKYCPFIMVLKTETGERVIFRTDKINSILKTTENKIQVIQLPYENISLSWTLPDGKRTVFERKNSFIYYSDRFPDGVEVPSDRTKLAHELKKISHSGADGLHPVSVIKGKLITASSNAIVSIDIKEIEKIAKKIAK